MTREPETPEDVRQAADLAASDRAESADGLPLPADDDEKRLARDTGDAEQASDDEEDEEQEVVEQISAERGAD